MAETTVSDLKVRLEGIRDERSTHANTAYRIGSAMLEMLSYAEAVAVLWICRGWIGPFP